VPPSLSTPLRQLRPLNRNLSRLINVLFRQVKHAIKRPLVVLKIAAAVGEEDAGIHHFGEANALAFLDLLDTGRVALLSRIFGDGPVGFFATRHTESGRQHVFLADGEGIDVDYAVFEVLKAGALVRALAIDGQTEKSGNRTTDLAKVTCWSGKLFGNSRPTCGHVEVEILASPSSKKVTLRLAKSIPKPAGIARLHSYQKPVDTEI